MALAQKLKDAVLQSAIQGKLTTQKDTDSSACELIENIKLTKAYWLSSKKISKDNSTKIQPYDYNVEDLIEVPKSWQWVKLGELCEKIGAGSTPDGGSKVYTQSGIKFLREQNIYNEGLRLDGVVYISDQTNHLMPGSQVQAKDILVNITGASIGRNALVPDDFDIANVNQHVLIIRLIDKRLRQYIHLCLCTPLVFNQMMANQKGDKPGLSATRVSNFLIPIPPLEEQQRIVAQVDKLMAQIDEYEQIEKQLIALKAQFPLNMRDAILQAAMQGKLTEQLDTDSSVDTMLQKVVDDKIDFLNGRVTKTDRRLFAGLPDDYAVPYDIPENWRWTILGYILRKLTDGTHKTPHYTSNGIKFLSVKDMSSGRIDFSNTKFISEEEHQELYQRCNPQKGDMLLSKVGTTGVPAYIETDEQFSLFVSVALLKFNHAYIYPKFLYYLICSPLVKKQADDNTRGVGNQNWVLDKIANTLIVLPPIEEQKRIAARLDELLPLCDELME